MAEARVLEGSELVQAAGDEQAAGERAVARFHHWRKQRHVIEPPLHSGRTIGIAMPPISHAGAGEEVEP
jgi:hypothetical protein